MIVLLILIYRNQILNCLFNIWFIDKNILSKGVVVITVESIQEIIISGEFFFSQKFQLNCAIERLELRVIYFD